MKIINEKGKILGIINIVDLCVVLFLICIVYAVYFYAYTPPQINEHQEVMFQMYFTSMQYSQHFYSPVVLQFFSPGNELLGGEIRGDSAIIKTLEIIDPVKATDFSEVNFLITLQGNLSIAPHGAYLFDNYQVAPGKTLTVLIHDSYFTGDVLRVNYIYEKENRTIILDTHGNNIFPDDGTLLFNSKGEEVGVILSHHTPPDFTYAILIQSDVYDSLPFYNHVIPLLPGQSLTFKTKDGALFTGVIREVQ